MPTGPRYDTVSLVEIDRKRLNSVPDRLHPVILVVDDEAVIADTLAAILRKQNYSVLVAYDAESAFDLVSVIPPELLISDVVMPGMSGVELA
ncbi:MAG TPA: response regulator, partial [Alloacidobacterium sp.]|nr:response regulator [Alloacidobacterium sp.]